MGQEKCLPVIDGRGIARHIFKFRRAASRDLSAVRVEHTAPSLLLIFEDCMYRDNNEERVPHLNKMVSKEMILMMHIDHMTCRFSKYVTTGTEEHVTYCLEKVRPRTAMQEGWIRSSQGMPWENRCLSYGA